MSRLKVLSIAGCVLFAALGCCAQQPVNNSQLQLLDRLAGDWVMQGTIAGKQTTHDLHAEWVLKRGYLHLHEVSREKNSAGGPQYEAIIFISWEPKTQEYTCLWLDNTEGGGLSAPVARAKPAPNAIPFVFSESLRNTFSYDTGSDTWRWLIENVTNGRPERFADLKLWRAH